MKTVGLVLPNLPAYSETFFRSKINGLLSHGFDVVLLVDRANGKSEFNCLVSAQQRVPANGLLKIIKLIWVTLLAILSMPKTTIAFLKAEKESRRSLRQRIENLFINYHILRLKRLDYLHFGFATMGVRRENVAKVLGARCSTSFRGYDIMVYPNSKKKVYQPLWKSVELIHSLSESLINTAREKYFLPDHIQTQIITPAVDISQFKPKADNVETSGVLRLITVSRLHWVKGLEYLIQAIGLVNYRNLDCTLEIIGDGSEYDRLVFAAHQCGVIDKIIFHGKKSHTEISDYLNSANIYVQYSNSEGFCNAVLEAQAIGMPCIVSNSGGLPENVVDGETGWVVPKRDPEVLAAKIIEVARTPTEIMEKVKAQARQRVCDHYNLEKQEKEFIHFFN